MSGTLAWQHGMTLRRILDAEQVVQDGPSIGRAVPRLASRRRASRSWVGHGVAISREPLGERGLADPQCLGMMAETLESLGRELYHQAKAGHLVCLLSCCWKSRPPAHHRQRSVSSGFLDPRESCRNFRSALINELWLCCCECFEEPPPGIAWSANSGPLSLVLCIGEPMKLTKVIRAAKPTQECAYLLEGVVSDIACDQLAAEFDARNGGSI